MHHRHHHVGSLVYCLVSLREPHKIFTDPLGCRKFSSQSPSGVQFPYGVDYRALRWIYFLDSPRGLGLWDLFQGLGMRDPSSLQPFSGKPCFGDSSNPDPWLIQKVEPQSTLEQYWHPELGGPSSWIRICGQQCRSTSSRLSSPDPREDPKVETPNPG